MNRPIRLSLETLTTARAEKPAYDPAALSIGVVHFGPGAFHRAHQAAYFDALAATDPRWGICGVSLHSTGVRDALTPQDGLYTLATLDADIGYRVIASIREVLVAPENPQAVFDRLKTCGIVTSTVTEKGYCLLPDGALDFGHGDIVHDLAHPRTPKSYIGYVVEGLRLRYTAGLPPFVLIPCDNLPSNGHRLKAAVVAFAARQDEILAEWIRTTLQCPCTMVDSITPATDDALRARVADAIGLEDAWPIQREAFTQWVIENHIHEDGPDWASVGVTLTDTVPAYERAKLRLLNGPHSTLAYVGLHKGYDSVSQAMSDPELADLVRDLMLTDIVPLLQAADPDNLAGMDLPGYCEAILKRFRNPAIKHLLSQIAWDGSQKLPIRLLSSIQEAVSHGRDLSRLAVPIAAWLRFIRAKAVSGDAITDPLAAELIGLGSQFRDDVSDVKLALTLRAVFPQALADNPAFVGAVEAAYQNLLA